MFLQLKHTNLDVFKITRLFVLGCYKQTNKLPGEEKYGIKSQIRRAALSTHLNIAEGCSRKSPLERRRFFEIARGSIVEVDTALDISSELGYFIKEDLIQLGVLMRRSFQIISKMIDP